MEGAWDHAPLGRQDTAQDPSSWSTSSPRPEGLWLAEP